MLRTQLCDLLGIEVTIFAARWDSLPGQNWLLRYAAQAVRARCRLEAGHILCQVTKAD